MMPVRLQLGLAVLVLLVSLGAGATAQTTSVPSGLRSVVYRDAPYVIAETFLSANPVGGSDHMLRVDFDGSTYGPGKAANGANRALIGDRTATAYFSAVESGFTSGDGYFFLGYYWYHPRDNGASVQDPFTIGHEDPGHEHDMEGVMFLVKKSPYLPFGTVIHAITQAHGEMVPYINPYQTTVPNTGSNGSPAYGYIEHWDDLRYGSQRQVAVVRGRNHGTHMPQACTPGASPFGQLDFGYGMKLDNPGGVYTACIHDGYEWILYRPMMEEALVPSTGLPQADVIPLDTTRGVYAYQLLELSQSPIWAQRLISGDLLNGTTLTGWGGFAGKETFYSLIDPGQANPPWQWQGGGGCQQHIGGAYCWYSFGVDGTSNYNDPTHWPVSPTYGRLLTDPAAEFGMRFSNLPQLDQPYRYNPYVPSPPNYDGPPPLSASISGPSVLASGEQGTWTAVAKFGVPPYTYQWSGALTGSGQSVSGYLSSSDDLFLDVWDSAGQHAVSQMYIYYTGCPGTAISC